MKTFEIWSEGYRATGEHGTAYLFGTMEAETFDQAVSKLVKQKSETTMPDIYKYYQSRERYVSCPVSDEHPLGRKLAIVHSIWACRLFDNEGDARKTCG